MGAKKEKKSSSEEEDRQKPRRLEQDTLEYLQQLAPKLKEDSLAAMDASEKEVLVENILAEIKQRLGSAMSDRDTHTLIEALCYAASLPQLLDILSSVTPYAVFLARNRHSAHCLQACFARCCFLLKNSGIPEELDGDQVKATVLALCAPLIKEISWLTKDLNGSHVVRSMLSCLAGIPVVSERKGKASKHQHSVSLSESLEKLTEAGKFYINKVFAFDVPEEFHDNLGQAVGNLTELSTDELQAMVADSTSAAVLGLIVRILANPDIVLGGSSLADSLVRKVLGLVGDSDESWTAVVYDMAGHRAGSYFLEAVAECCAVDLLHTVVAKGVVGKLKEYVLDGSANFVVQAVLRRLYWLLLGAADPSLPWLELSSQLLQELSTDATFFRDMMAKRGGVVHAALEVAVAGQTFLRTQPQTKTAAAADNWCERLGRMTLAARLNVDAAVSDAELREKLTEHLAVALVPPGKKEAGEVLHTTQLLLCKQLGSIMKSLHYCGVGKLAMEVFAQLPAPVLLYVAQTGQLSRATFDVFFQEVASNAYHRGIISTLVERFQTHYAALGCNYGGLHVFRQLYTQCKLPEKEAMLVELAAAKEALARSKEGRNVMALVNLELFLAKKNDWVQWAQQQKKQLLAAPVTATVAANVLGGSGGAGQSAGSGGTEEAGAAGTGEKKTRKRKRGGKKNDAAALDEEQQPPESAAKKQK